MELKDAWLTEEIFTAEKEVCLAIPRDQRRAILTHLKESQKKEKTVDDGHADGILRMDALMTRVLGLGDARNYTDEFIGVPEVQRPAHHSKWKAVIVPYHLLALTYV